MQAQYENILCITMLLRKQTLISSDFAFDLVFIAKFREMYNLFANCLYTIYMAVCGLQQQKITFYLELFCICDMLHFSFTELML